jgi:hypothetical protein
MIPKCLKSKGNSESLLYPKSNFLISLHLNIDVGIAHRLQADKSEVINKGSLRRIIVVISHYRDIIL